MSDPISQSMSLPVHTETRSRRKTQSQKEILSRALAKAHDAVQYDNQHNPVLAVTTYREACELLERVMCRSSESERNKLDSIRQNYQSRIDELMLDSPGLETKVSNIISRDRSDETLAPADLAQATNKESPGKAIKGHNGAQSTLAQDIGDHEQRGSDLRPELRSNRIPRTLQLEPLPLPQESIYMPAPLSPWRSIRSATSPASYFSPQLGTSSSEKLREIPVESALSLDTDQHDPDSSSESTSSRPASADAFPEMASAGSMSELAQLESFLDAAINSAYDDSLSALDYSNLAPLPVGRPTSTTKVSEMPVFEYSTDVKAKLVHAKAEVRKAQAAAEEATRLEARTRTRSLGRFSPLHGSATEGSDESDDENVLNELSHLHESTRETKSVRLPRESGSSRLTSNSQGGPPDGRTLDTNTVTGGAPTLPPVFPVEPSPLLMPNNSVTQTHFAEESDTNLQDGFETHVTEAVMPSQGAGSKILSDAHAGSQSAMRPASAPFQQTDPIHAVQMDNRKGANAMNSKGRLGRHLNASESSSSLRSPGPSSTLFSSSSQMADTSDPASSSGPPSTSQPVPQRSTNQATHDPRALANHTHRSRGTHRPLVDRQGIRSPRRVLHSRSTTSEISFLRNDGLRILDNSTPVNSSGQRPNTLEPCPVSYLLRPFWLMRCFYRTIAHPRGGFVSPTLYVPRDIWKVKNVRLKCVDDKVAQSDLLTAALQKLSGVDQNDADAVLEELQSFELVMDQVQAHLSKKLGSEVGMNGASSILKQPAKDDVKGDSSSSKSGVAKSYLTSWRRLKSKNSMPPNSSHVPNSHVARDLSGEPLPSRTFPMTTQLDRKQHSKSRKRVVKGIGANANYMTSLARLCDAAQVLDQIACQIEDPGLRHSSQTHVGLELCIRHAADFFAFYVCRFALNDIGMMLDKFLKRGSEWALS